MLPSSEGRFAPVGGSEAKYADHALVALLDGMKQKGARPERLVSKLVGGAKTFTNENSAADMFNIGERNYLTIKTLLAASNIPILAENVGSTQGRWVKLDVNTGAVTVKNRASEVIL
jgi:chemotaxis receptor (MCP) glutamine deamidase CheD